MISSGGEDEKGWRFIRYPWLSYKAEAAEAAFLTYSHNKPIRGALIACILAVPALYFSSVLNPDGEYVVAMIPTAIFGLLQTILHIVFAQVETVRPQLLLVERVALTIGCIGLILGYNYAAVTHFDRCESQKLYIGIDDREAFSFSRCHRFISPMGLVGLTYMLLMQVPRFVHFAMLAVLNIVSILLLAAIFRPPDAALMIPLMIAFNAAGGFFVCTVRHDHESTQRRQFEVFSYLVEQQERLELQRHETLLTCNEVLPAALVSRIQRSDLHQTDTSNSAVIIVSGVSDFARWCTDNTPFVVAFEVAAFQSKVDKIWVENGIDRIARLGDSVIGAGNLLQRLDNACAVGCHVASRLVLKEKVKTTGGSIIVPVLESSEKVVEQPEIPIRSIVHQGKLRGQLVGGQYVRYDVRGDALDVAMAGLGFATGGEVWATHPVTDALGRESEDAIDSDRVEFIPGLHAVRLRPDAFADPPAEATQFSTDLASGLVEFTPLVVDQIDFTSPLNALEDALEFNTSMRPRGKSLSASVMMSQSMGRGTSAASSSTNSSQLVNNNGGKDKEKKAEDDPSVIFALAPAKCVIFEEFSHPPTELWYLRERKIQLPLQAGKAWLAYAGFTLVSVLMLFADFPSDTDGRAPAAVVLLIFACLASVFLALWPRFVSDATREKYFLAWSIFGSALPLVTVYGCALSRPSAVGIDVRGYMAVGALVRSYCFTTSRWHAIVIPITLGIAVLEVLLPGGQIWSANVLVFYVVVLVTIALERGREGEARTTFQRVNSMKYLVSRTEAAAMTQRRLLRTWLPNKVFDKVLEDRMSDKPIAQANMLGAVPPPETEAFANNAVIALIRVSGGGAGWHSPGARTAPLATLQGKVFDIVSEYPLLSIVTVFGDEAVAAGPILVGDREAKEEEVAAQQALALAVRLASVRSAAVAMNVSDTTKLDGSLRRSEVASPVALRSPQAEAFGGDDAPLVHVAPDLIQSPGNSVGGVQQQQQQQAQRNTSTSLGGLGLGDSAGYTLTPINLGVQNHSTNSSSGNAAFMDVNFGGLEDDTHETGANSGGSGVPPDDDSRSSIGNGLDPRIPPINPRGSGGDSSSYSTGASLGAPQSSATSSGIPGLLPAHPGSPAGAQPVDVLMDFDMAIHMVAQKPQPRYALLGVGMTRVHAIARGAQYGTLRGVLLTERMMTLADALGAFASQNIKTEIKPPMKIRGAGVLRLHKIVPEQQ